MLLHTETFLKFNHKHASRRMEMMEMSKLHCVVTTIEFYYATSSYYAIHSYTKATVSQNQQPVKKFHNIPLHTSKFPVATKIFEKAKMGPTPLELRPNRHLMDHEFEGYKLNLQALPHFSHELKDPVDRLYPDEIQYSFIHAKLFALHNHLVPDHWDYNLSYYYIDKTQQIRHLTFDTVSHAFQVTPVYDVPAHVERKSGHFNLSLSFPSNSLAVVGDGTGYLHIISTPNRTAGRKQSWVTVLSTPVIGNKYFVVIDSRIHDNNGQEILNCLLQSVEQTEYNFFSVLTWVTFECTENTWRQTSLRQLQCKGIMHYAAIETSCTGLYLVSDHPFKYITDTEKEVVVKMEDEPYTILYTWLQTTEDVTVTLKLQENYKKELLAVNVTSKEIKVSYAGKSIINGKLHDRVDCELTTWNIQDNGEVNILLTKADGVFWSDLIEGGDKNGEQIMDASLVEEVHKRLAHLCSETEAVESNLPVPGLSTQELEECDAASEEDTTFVRVDINHETTHRMSLSVHQYICSLRIEPQAAPALVLRHDVDACIWQPYSRPVYTDNCSFFMHRGTLMAFGYIQSSKQNRKFLTCPPNFAYSVVCESSRHIFIYQNKSSSDCQLRNRSGGVVRNVKIGQQNVFNVEKYGEVLGIDATNDFLFILTENNVLAIGIQ